MIETIRTIEDDYDSRRPPFDNATFPEERVLDHVEPASREQRAIAVTLFSMFDYNRDATRLAENIVELYDEEPALTDFSVVQQLDERRVADHFEQIGFRYPNRDARTLYKNASIIHDDYDDSLLALYCDVSCNAPSLVERLDDDGFLCLSGDKIAPMYVRFVDDYICPLSNVWELDIPVDTHIRRLSRDLFDDSMMDDDEIRRTWRSVAYDHDVSRHVVDAALWQIGANWNEWGEDYWTEVRNS